jgi:hypothetical protein
MYSVGCAIDDNQRDKEISIPAAKLGKWISDSIERGIYTPGECDIIINDRGRLSARLCHESDIHIETVNPAVIAECVTRWLEMGHPIHRKSLTAGKGWKSVWSVGDAISALNIGD